LITVAFIISIASGKRGVDMNKDSEKVRRKAQETNTVQSNDPPRWSPWNFQNTKRDWHKDIYDEAQASEHPTDSAG
jgi:hypothetical protein